MSLILIVVLATSCSYRNKPVVDNACTQHKQKLDEIKWKDKKYSLVKLDNKIFKTSDKSISMNDGNVVIAKGGTYVFSGYFYGAVKVDTKDEVTLVLNNVQVFSSNGPAIYIENAEKVNLVLEDGTINTISDKTIHKEYNGAIYSNADLFISGKGAMFIEATSGGIICKSGVLINHSTVNIVSEETGIDSSNCVHMLDGTLGIYSENDVGIKCTGHVDILDGFVNIKNSEEGIQGQYINILGGKIEVTSTDNAINGTEKTEDIKDDNAILTIKGGDIKVNAEGDGIDIDGKIVMTGGNLVVNGPASSDNQYLDYEQSFEYAGGTVVCSGNSTMTNKPTNETISSIFVDLGKKYTKEDKVVIKSADGEELLKIENPKEFSKIYIVSDKLKEGKTYSIVSNGKEITKVNAQK